MSMRLIYLLTCTSVLSLACLDGPATSNERLARLNEPGFLDSVAASIPSVLDSGQVTGLAIAFANDSGVVWSAGFGMADREAERTVDTSTVFEAASLSKPVFAYAFLQLVDNGTFELDEPIADFYSYDDITHDSLYTRITPRHVLTHSPGFPNWRTRGGQLSINFEPGSEFSYSGEGFVYLQRAVMDVTGETLDQLTRRLVFDPLDMPNSSYIWQERFEDAVALPYNSNGEVGRKYKPRPGQGNAAASLHTTAPDFARFLAAVMRGDLLRDSTAVAMLSPQIEVDSGVTWGLGIGLQENDRGTAFWHWGDNGGFKAYTISYPESGVGAVWFTNSDNGQAILDAMLGLVFGGDHPASRWLGYEQHDSPGRFVREELQRVYGSDGIQAAIDRYHELKTTGPADAFGESLLNTLGYRLLGNGMVQDAIAAFELNVAEYPDASNPYDSLGEAYLVAGDTVRAIENYQQSVELDPGNTNGAAILERLRAATGGD